MSVSEAQLTIRLPARLRDELDRLHERTRVPTSEVARYLIETGLARYRQGKHFDSDSLVEDVAEYVNAEPAAPLGRRPRSRTNAAA